MIAGAAEVCAFMTTVLSTLNKLDEALITGTRALDIARRLGDARLRMLATSYLEQAYYYRGEYAHVIEFAADILAALPADWIHEYFGMAVPASVFGRAWVIMSLAELGQFAEAAEYEAAVIQLAEPTQHAHTIGWAHLALEHAPPRQRRLGKGALAGRAVDSDHADWQRRRVSALGGGRLRLDAGAGRRGERGNGPNSGR